MLPSVAAPPEDLAALEKELAQKIPRPPARKSVTELVDEISRRPGQAEKMEATKRGGRPGNVQTRATLTLSYSTDKPEPFSITLSPQMADVKLGARDGLRSPDGSAYAYLLGAMVYWSFPNNQAVYLRRGNFYDHNTTNPLAYFRVTVPGEGWYTINMNAYAHSNVQLKRGSALLEDLPRQAGWADYSSLQYLEQGSHYLQFVMPSGGYVSRLTVDCFKC